MTERETIVKYIEQLAEVYAKQSGLGSDHVLAPSTMLMALASDIKAGLDKDDD